MNGAWVVYTIKGGGDNETLLAVKKEIGTFRTLRHLGCKNFALLAFLGVVYPW